ncbi:alpha-amylase family glycosyl hydrolase [Fulvivirga ligni]|uniref:alpha-amylase family glycosyl hydrolase n=1 Tax=Fulvivirga ligni TaxID=2904246 RepID=UPI001F354002|nr:alpha-amylase family glycosyl hydrolase [Fulvivirga ligni]UII21214.1 carbohydrate-binding protein [Fulvivirga ligni]
MKIFSHFNQLKLMKLALQLLVLLCFSFTAKAQDPPQYGTPFNGVPDPRDVNMYQVNIRAFSSGGDLQGVIARLDQIKNVGTNVIYLLPVYPVGEDSRSKIASSTSPYSIKDFKSVGSEYGSLSDLRALVDGAHARGMAVMLDFVVNQTSWDHPWITQHPDWYVRNGAGEIQQLANFSDVAALNFNSSSMRSAMIDALRYWVFAANIDGYRMDFANNPPLDFWTQANNNLRGIASHDLLLFAEGDRLENFNVGFDLNFGDKWYYDALTDINDGASVSLIQSVTNTEYTYASGSQQVVRYTGNHDTSGDGTPLEVFESTSGVMANFVVSAYMRGVPFLYGGQEVAFPTRIPWPWDGVDINWNGNSAVTAEFKKVLDFRTSSNAIRRGSLTNYSNNNVCAFTKTSGSEEVLVLVNLRNYNTSISLPGSITSAGWNDAYTGNSSNVGSTVNLGAYEYRVYTKGSGGNNNQAPTANAGADKNLSAGVSSTTLNGSGSDPDNNPLSYSWAQISGPSANINNSNSASTGISGLTNGNTYVFRLTVNDGQLSATDDVQVTVAPSNNTQSPFGGSPIALPGTVEAENYDNGGDGVAYHDVDGSNNGGQYRASESVDIEASSQGGYNVGWTSSGEWLEYTVNVAAAGNYTLAAQVASASGGNFRVEFNGSDKTGVLNVPNTGGWQSWQTINSGQFTLSAGTQIMRIYMNTGGYNIDKVTISSANGGGGGSVFRIKNRWQNTYLYDNGNQLAYGTPSASNQNSQWTFETVDGHTAIKNVGTGDYINIENQYGYVECTSVPTSYWSAQWAIEDYDGYKRLRNRWVSDRYIHIEQLAGYAQCSSLYAGSHSNHWTFESVGSGSQRLGFDEGDDQITELKVYPNPSSGLLHVELKTEKADFILYDVKGSVLMQGSLTSSVNIVDISKLKAGLYTALIRDESGTTCVRVIKE